MPDPAQRSRTHMKTRSLLFLLFAAVLCPSETWAQETLSSPHAGAETGERAATPDDAAKLEESLADLKEDAGRGNAHAAQQVYLRYAAAGKTAEAKAWGRRYMDLLTTKAKEGDIPSALKLAQIHIQGSEFTPPDRKAARHWLRKAADGGNARSTYLLALLVEEDKSDPEAAQKAADLYARALQAYRRDASAAPSDNGESFYWIGFMTLHGLGTKPAPGEAVSWLQKADEAGFPAASAQLAKIYSEGIGVPADAARAFHYRKRMADTWHAPEMMYQVAVQYGRGEGTTADASQAGIYMQRAADAGYPPALLARAAAAMKRGDEGSAQALALYERAASLGNVAALTQAGDMYLHGIGTERNEEKGLALLHFAADQHGDAVAAYKLARHEEGLGNRREADAWYFAASDRGHPAAMARRGLLHLLPNSGYAWNPLRSYHWWRIGKERGDEVSARYLGWLLWAGLPLSALVIFVLPLSLLAKLHRDSLRREAEENGNTSLPEEDEVPAESGLAKDDSNSRR